MALSPDQEQKLNDNLMKYGNPMSVREHPAWITMMLYGNYKVGKTVQVCKIGRRPLLFACDKNWISLKDYPELQHVDVHICQGLNHFEAFVQALVNKMEIYQDNDHVIIDPFNALVDAKLDWLQDNYTPSKQGDNRTTWNPKPGRPDTDARTFTSAGMSDYQVVRDYFRRFIPILGLLDKHVTFVCHVREPGFADPVKDIRSAVPGKTHELVARNMNLIGYMEDKGNAGRTISFEAHNRHDGGSCFKNLHGKVIDAERLPELYLKYENERNFDNV